MAILCSSWSWAQSIGVRPPVLGEAAQKDAGPADGACLREDHARAPASMATLAASIMAWMLS